MVMFEERRTLSHSVEVADNSWKWYRGQTGFNAALCGIHLQHIQDLNFFKNSQ